MRFISRPVSGCATSQSEERVSSSQELRSGGRAKGQGPGRFTDWTRLSKTLGLRAEALRVLHLQEIALLRRWRELRNSGDEAAADKLLPELLLSINAIASGLRTTG